MDVFSRYQSTYCVSPAYVKTIVRASVDIITRHAYLPKTIHAQTIGILERCHASLKEALKISTGELRTTWHQFVPIATLNYKTTYHSALGYEPSRVFHLRVPYNVLELKFGLKQSQTQTPTTDTGADIVPKTRIIHEQAPTTLVHTVQTILRQENFRSPYSSK